MDASLSGESSVVSDGGTWVKGGSTNSKYGRLIVRTDFTVYFSRFQLVVEMPLHLTGMGVALDEKETGGGPGLGVIQGPIFGALEPSADFKLHHPVQRHRDADAKAEDSESISLSLSQSEAMSDSASYRGEESGVIESNRMKVNDIDKEKAKGGGGGGGGYSLTETAALPENQMNGMPVTSNSSSSMLAEGARTRRGGRKLGDGENDPLAGMERDRGQGRNRERDRDRGHGSRKSLRNAGVLDPSSDRTDRHSLHDPPASVSDISSSIRGGEKDRDRERDRERESGDGTEREAKRAPWGRQAVEGEYALIELPVATAAIMHFRYCTVSHSARNSIISHALIHFFLFHCLFLFYSFYSSPLSPFSSFLLF
jgi:hypothetical protein